MSAPELDLDAIAERASIATPGPWRAAEKADRGRLGAIEIIGGIPCSYVAEIERIGADNQEDRDRDFIVAARADVPALAAEVRRLRGDVERLTVERDLAREEWDEASKARDIWRAKANNGHWDRKAIARAMGCEPDDDADLVEAVRLLVGERDAARAEADAMRGVVEAARGLASVVWVEDRDYGRATIEPTAAPAIEALAAALARLGGGK